jgi:hypothetical protein
VVGEGPLNAVGYILLLLLLFKFKPEQKVKPPVPRSLDRVPYAIIRKNIFEGPGSHHLLVTPEWMWKTLKWHCRSHMVRMPTPPLLMPLGNSATVTMAGWHLKSTSLRVSVSLLFFPFFFFFFFSFYKCMINFSKFSSTILFVNDV